jgi:hypothetical protein
MHPRGVGVDVLHDATRKLPLRQLGRHAAAICLGETGDQTAAPSPFETIQQDILHEIAAARHHISSGIRILLG